jgi:hypothetical protein
VTAVNGGVTFDRSYPGRALSISAQTTGQPYIVAILLTFAIYHNYLYFLPSFFSLKSSYIELIYA